MKRIILRDYGIVPGVDCTLALCRLMAENNTDTEFVFEDGEYFFSPKEEMHADYRISNSVVTPYRVLGIWMKNAENCVLEGNGAKLYYSGQMQAMTFDHCRNITVRNFTINWKKPLVAEGIVRAFDGNTVDLYVNPEVFPHRYNGNTIEFDVGNDEWYPLTGYSQIQFDANTRCVRRASGDNFTAAKVEDIGNDVYRITPRGKVDIAVGNIFVLRHNNRIHAGIFTEKCADMLFENITVHSCGGLGCLAQFSRDITYRAVNFLPDIEAGRLVSGGRDDGMQITCNSGTFTVENCSFMGLMDDPINVHGCCTIAENAENGAENGDIVHCRYGHGCASGFLYWAERGDTISFIDRKHMNSVFSAEITDFIYEDFEHFTLKFASALPESLIEEIKKGDAISIDNISHSANFICRGNRFGSCRARGILISTAGHILIENNYFASSGTSILVAGDSNEWYESGECHDVEIRGNVFTDVCLSSMYQFCEGVISVCPVVPVPVTDLPFHKNIRIHDNVFDTAGTPVLYAFSTENISFTGNRIFSSPAHEGWHPRKELLGLEYCKNALVSDNIFTGLFTIDKTVSVTDCSGVYSDIQIQEK